MFFAIVYIFFLFLWLLLCLYVIFILQFNIKFPFVRYRIPKVTFQVNIVKAYIYMLYNIDKDTVVENGFNFPLLAHINIRQHRTEIVLNLLAYFPSSCTEIFWHTTVCLRNFYTIWRKIWLRIFSTISVRCCLKNSLNIRLLPIFRLFRFENMELLKWAATWTVRVHSALCMLYKIDDSDVCESRVSLWEKEIELASVNVNCTRQLAAGACDGTRTFKIASQTAWNRHLANLFRHTCDFLCWIILGFGNNTVKVAVDHAVDFLTLRAERLLIYRFQYTVSWPASTLHSILVKNKNVLTAKTVRTLLFYSDKHINVNITPA